jgi:hypothetical protein
VKPLPVNSLRQDTPDSCTLQRNPAAAKILLNGSVFAGPGSSRNSGCSSDTKRGSPSRSTMIAFTASGSPSTPRPEAQLFAAWQPALARGKIAHLHLPLGVVK